MRVADLVPGDIGVLEVEVRQVKPTQVYQRKRGGEGLRARIVLGDASGEVEMVLWDDETRQVRDGPFQPGARLLIAGAPVRPGFRGGVELGFPGARVTVQPPLPDEQLEGIIDSLGPTRVVGEPPFTFEAEATLRTQGGPQQVLLTGAALLAARGIPLGTNVLVHPVRRNPALEGWWWTTPATRCEPASEGGPARNS